MHNEVDPTRNPWQRALPTQKPSTQLTSPVVLTTIGGPSHPRGAKRRETNLYEWVSKHHDR